MDWVCYWDWLNILLVGILEVEALIWEMQCPRILNRMDVGCEVAAIVKVVIGNVVYLMVDC